MSNTPAQAPSSSPSENLASKGPITFADFYPFAAFEAAMAHDAARPRDEKGDSDWNSAEYKAWNEVFKNHWDVASQAVDRFLVAKRERGELKPIEFSKGRGIWVVHNWNQFVEGKGHESGSGDQLAYAAVYGTRRLRERDLAMRESYENAVAQVNAGDMHWLDLNMDGECCATGERLKLDFKGWQPRLGRIDRSTRPAPDDESFGFKPLTQDVPEPKVQHLVIDAPSGELLTCDYFRIDGFREAVERANDHEYPSINNRVGKALMSAHYAENHGFTSVFVGDRSPRVIQRDGHIAIGVTGEGTPAGNDVTYVCTDLWWATVIDRQVLTDILAKTHPREKAEELVKGYIEDSVYTVGVLKVKPGKLHVYHCDEPYAMQRFRCPDVPQTHITQMFAVVSEKELEWVPATEEQLAAEQQAEDAVIAEQAEASARRRRRP